MELTMASTATRSQSTLRTWMILVAFFVSAGAAQQCTSYEGGWALRSSRSCPPSAPIECGVGAQPRCCPSGFACTGEGDYVGNFCCSDPTDCVQLSTQQPQCPDSSWTLWGVDGKLDNGGWCCLAGTNGTYREDSAGIALLCMSETVTSLPTSIFWAKTVSTTSCTSTATSSSATATTGTATDSATDSAATDSATPTGTGTRTETATPAESTAASAPAEGGSSGMSGGAVAGAVVGGILGLALIVALGFFMWRRKRKAAAQPAPAPAGTREEEGSAWAMNEQKANYGNAYGQGGVNELAVSAPRAEMDGGHQPTFELDASNTHELDSTPRRT